VDQLLKQGIGELLPIAASWTRAGQYLDTLVEKSWYESLVRHALNERPSLKNFDHGIHEQRIERFQKLDLQVLHLNKVRLAYQHWQRLPNHQAGGQLGILKREFEKKRRHLPIRKLIQQAGNAIQAIKPVFMMSPLSIAMFLPPDSVTFDLVVFDEASQVRPVDAFGALLRGKQAAVVGDQKQLPPTSMNH
jgi:superfamily I DNA and/or RNA helicase